MVAGAGFKVPKSFWTEVELKGMGMPINNYRDGSVWNDELDKLLKEIVGLDESGIDNVFAEFLLYNRLNANQLRFMEMLKQQIKLHGTIQTEMLFEQPFTQIHTEGLFGVFPEEQAMNLVELIKPYQNPMSEQ